MYKLFARRDGARCSSSRNSPGTTCLTRSKSSTTSSSPAAARDTLGPVNPLAQVPTLVLPGGGQVMRCVWVCGGGSG